MADTSYVVNSNAVQTIKQKMVDNGDGTFNMGVTGGGSSTSPSTTIMAPGATFTATIADTATVSGAVDLGVYRATSLYVPATFEGTAITFQGSLDGTLYAAIKDMTGTLLTVVTVNNTVNSFSLTPSLFYGWRYIKLVAGTAQTGATTITIGGQA